MANPDLSLCCDGDGVVGTVLVEIDAECLLAEAITVECSGDGELFVGERQTELEADAELDNGWISGPGEAAIWITGDGLVQDWDAGVELSSDAISLVLDTVEETEGEAIVEETFAVLVLADGVI